MNLFAGTVFLVAMLVSGCASTPTDHYRPSEATLKFRDTREAVQAFNAITKKGMTVVLGHGSDGSIPMNRAVKNWDVRVNELHITSNNGEQISLPYDQITDLRVVEAQLMGVRRYAVVVRPDLALWFVPTEEIGNELSRNAAITFADLLFAYRATVLEDTDESFRAATAVYLRGAPKPPISEEMRRHDVQAEAFIKQKRFNEALSVYNAALKQWPWWSEARYNRALVLAELKRYGAAAKEMSRYLELEPRVASRRQLQDQIYEWEVLGRR